MILQISGAEPMAYSRNVRLTSEKMWSAG